MVLRFQPPCAVINVPTYLEHSRFRVTDLLVMNCDTFAEEISSQQTFDVSWTSDRRQTPTS